MQLYEVGLSQADELFQNAKENVQTASNLCSGLHHSLASLREACGVIPLASVKQCVRALAQRYPGDQSAADMLSDKAHPNENGIQTEVPSGGGPLRRQISNASQSSNESSVGGAQIVFIRRDRKISVEMKGGSGGESWRRVSLAVDALVSNCILVRDSAMNYCNLLTSVCDKAQLLYTVST